MTLGMGTTHQPRQGGQLMRSLVVFRSPAHGDAVLHINAEKRSPSGIGVSIELMQVLLLMQSQDKPWIPGALQEMFGRGSGVIHRPH